MKQTQIIDFPTNALTKAALRSMAATEAIASIEIENGKLPDRDRFIIRCSAIWPDVEGDLCGKYYDRLKS